MNDQNKNLPSKIIDPEFEKWAKRQGYINLTKSPYPDSFRLYAYDRTQHMWEEYCALQARLQAAEALNVEYRWALKQARSALNYVGVQDHLVDYTKVQIVKEHIDSFTQQVKP